MRLRSTLAAAVSAFALVLTLPTSASAAEGEFSYTYLDPQSGGWQSGKLTDPPSGPCINLPEVENYYVPPAHTPRNSTNRAAIVFVDTDCNGPSWHLRPGGSAGDRLQLRSVIFS
ncbi:hypothetical protein [Streptomyces flavidovirens]|uniref:hypothetical protein n=1 Tax=Streptomyces flavidovirens TaxID=67298 RepID=UPI0036752EBB